MAGDWIKLENVTPDKPEVIQMADLLEIDQDAVLGKLVRLWIWADEQTFSGDASRDGVSVTKTFIDRHTCVSGFATAMENVGWLSTSTGGFAFPNFDRHNGQTAKARALTSKRTKRWRDGHRDAPGVTFASPEKRREENNNNPPLLDIPPMETPAAPADARPKKAKRFVPPTVAEVAAYCLERRNGIDAKHFVAYYEANGWRVGRNPMASWQAAVRTWEKNGVERQGTKGPRKLTQLS